MPYLTIGRRLVARAGRTGFQNLVNARPTNYLATYPEFRVKSGPVHFSDRRAPTQSDATAEKEQCSKGDFMRNNIIATHVRRPSVCLALAVSSIALLGMVSRTPAQAQN